LDNEKKPLGYIQLTNNIQKPVYPTDDFFIIYIFDKRENWQHLRAIVNIILEEYAKRYNRQDGFHMVDEDIFVRTQYKHYFANRSKQPSQDLEMNEIRVRKRTYVEVQNNSATKPPIAVRAGNYNGLAVNKAKDGAEVSQIWLLAENDDNVLCGLPISNFRMREDNIGVHYPRANNIMFVSLPRLAEENSVCGELARLLLGKVHEPKNGELNGLADMFKSEYDNFKQNEEVVKRMTILQEKYAEGMAEGEAKADIIAESKVEMLYNTRIEEMITAKIKNNEPDDFIMARGTGMGLNSERVEELIRKGRGQ
jgi:SHS2 domain-containing protein